MARGNGDPNGKGQAFRDKIEARQRSERRQNRHKGEFADYAGVDANLLHDAIVKVTAHNFAIQFGYTKDSGTYVIRIVGDGDPYNDFVRPTEDINEYLKALAADYAK